MPELPEVEITRLGLLPAILNRRVTGVEVRNPALRYPVPEQLAEILKGQRLDVIDRRGKYLLLSFGEGVLIIHLGMSGSLRVLNQPPQPSRHDHLDILFGDTVLRLRDPRRFGAVLWHRHDASSHPLLARLGLEPLSDELTGEWLHRATRRRQVAIKQLLMDSHTLVGVGNIYASESLFRAGIRPATRASSLSRVRCARLVSAIKDTLQDALSAGGSSLRDFAHSDGTHGWFQNQYRVYDRAGEPCHSCGAIIRGQRMGQRSSFYCPHCQR